MSAPEHPKIIAFASYIGAVRDGKQVADRKDINPAEIRPFLPHIMILDIVDGGLDFSVRIFGTELVTLLGEERTGLLASQFGSRTNIETDHAKLRRRWFRLFETTHKNGEILYFKTPTVTPNRAFMHYHGAFAPLTNGGQDIAQLIGIMVAVTD
tara:strand:+ start:118612 stop:119073 length:462 start_codon:yes stop_codon:yes gene_type:complete